jgi:glycosyltransferase involved in cell wall biosynthesis
VNTTAHRLLQTWQRQAELLVVPTVLARDLLVLGGLPDTSVVVKPHFVRDPGPRKTPPSTSRTVLYAGRLAPEKGVLALVEAWRRSPPPGLELLLVGDGDLRQVVEWAGSGIRVSGWQSQAELTELMLQARAVIAPSQLFETFGLTAVEAMAAGTPVITVSGSAIAEVAGGAGPAGVLSPSSTAEWQDRLHQLCEPSAVDAWGTAARQRFEERFDPTHGIDSLLAVYRTAIARRNQSHGTISDSPSPELHRLPADPDHA